MSIKKIKIISAIGVFLLCFLTHFLYELFPNFLFSIFFPVNESIFEHVKMIFTTFLLYSIIEYILQKKYNVLDKNFLFNTLFTTISCIIIYLTIYLPIYYTFGENMIFTISWLFVSIIISEIISFHMYSLRKINYSNVLALMFIIILYIIIGYFTYYPLKLDFFFDPKHKIYGINYKG